VALPVLAACAAGIGNTRGYVRGLTMAADRRVASASGKGGAKVTTVSRDAHGRRIAVTAEPRPLYHLPELLATKGSGKLVVIGGSDKAAEAARNLGFVATTSGRGSRTAGKTDWKPLADRDVLIVPDNDAAGEKYACDVARLAHAAGAVSVRILHLNEHAPDLPAGGDLAVVIADPGWCGLPLGDAAERSDLAAFIEKLAQAVTPWRPDQAKEPIEDLTFRLFPVDALPEPIRGFVDAGARAIGCDPSYLALPLLVALSAAIGNTRRLELKRGWTAPPILWGAIVGESGTAKTPAFRLVIRPVEERQRKALEDNVEAERQFEGEYAKYERDFALWTRTKNTSDPPNKPNRPQAERFMVSDTTIEALAPMLFSNPRGLLLARDELNGWIGSFDRYAGKGRAGADAANWLSMFNAGTIVVDRKTGEPRTIYVPRAAVCICGGIQPGILRRALSSEHRESGLAGRLLLAYPPRKAKQWTEADIDPAAEAKLNQLFDQLYKLQPMSSDDGKVEPVLVRLIPDAKNAWTGYYNRHAAEQAELTGDVAAAWSKLEEYAARLALVIHFVRWAAGDLTLASENSLDADSMKAGITLIEWFKHEARRVYTMLDESDVARDKRRLVEWIGNKGGIASPRECQQGCRWLKEPGKAEAELEELVKEGRGSWQPAPSTPKGGRPARVFALSSPSTSTKP